MNVKNLRIVGFLELGDTALCVSCAKNAYILLTALGSNIIQAIRKKDVIGISADLHCVRCVKVIAKKGAL